MERKKKERTRERRKAGDSETRRREKAKRRKEGKKEEKRTGKRRNRFVAANSSSILSTRGNRPLSFYPSVCCNPLFSTMKRLERWLLKFILASARAVKARAVALRVWIDGRPIMRLNLNGIIASSERTGLASCVMPLVDIYLYIYTRIYPRWWMEEDETVDGCVVYMWRTVRGVF